MAPRLAALLTQELSSAVEILRQGGLVAVPTETVYGLGADAQNELAVRRIFAVKGRPQTHPLIVHLGHPDAMDQWAQDIPASARKLAAAFWPGPLTLVLQRSPKALDVVTGGQDTVALRVPAHPLALALLQNFGGGIAAPSANRFGRVSPTQAEHVRTDLGDQVDYILDGGPCSVGVESTIVDLSRDRPLLLRPGGLAKERIEAVLGAPLLTDVSGVVRAPGVLESHYAPKVGVLLATASTFERVFEKASAEFVRIAVLAPVGTVVPTQATLMQTAEDAEGQARELYRQLRAVDSQGFDVVIALMPEEIGLGLAVTDRLRKAAAPRNPVG